MTTVRPSSQVLVVPHLIRYLLSPGGRIRLPSERRDPLQPPLEIKTPNVPKRSLPTIERRLLRIGTDTLVIYHPARERNPSDPRCRAGCEAYGSDEDPGHQQKQVRDNDVLFTEPPLFSPPGYGSVPVVWSTSSPTTYVKHKTSTSLSKKTFCTLGNSSLSCAVGR